MATRVELEPGIVSSRLHSSPLADSSNKTLMEDSAIFNSDPKKPTPGPKPILTPKPYTPQRNVTIRPILAPKPQPKPKPESVSKPEPPSKPNLTSPSYESGTTPTSGLGNKPDPSSPLNDADKLKSTETGSVTRRTSFVSQSKPAEWTPRSKTGSSIARAKSMGFLGSVGLEEVVGKEGNEVNRHPQETRISRPRPVSAYFLPDSTDSSTSTPPRQDRRPLSSDLTAKFEPAAQRQPTTGESKENTPETPAPEDGFRRREQEHADFERGFRKKDAEGQDAKRLERTGSGIKRRISLLFDSSASTLSVPATRVTEPRSPVSPIADTDGVVGVKQRVKELTEDFSSTPTPPQKLQVKPRPLATDRTKCFATDADAANSSDLKSVHDGVDELDKKPKDFPLTGQTKPQEDRTLPADASSCVQTVRASVYENVVEKHSVHMIEDANSKPRRSLSLRMKETSLFTGMGDEDDISLVKATYQNVVSPTSPKCIDHVFDMVASVEESRAVSENVPGAHLEEKALTLRRSTAGERPPEFSMHDGVPGNEQNRYTVGSGSLSTDNSKQSSGSATERSNTRYLRVGALPKWDETYVDRERDVEMEKQRETVRKMEEEIQRQMEVHMAAKADIEDDEFRQPKVPETVEQQMTKPRATYFALTGQLNETVHQRAGLDEEEMFSGTRRIADDGVKPEMAFEDFSVKAGRRGFQNRGPSIRRNPSQEPAFRQSSQKGLEIGEKEQETQKPAEYDNRRELERQRELERDRERQTGLERERQKELERQRELWIEKGRQRELERERQLERDREKEREREIESQRELERERQLERDRERQMGLERERQKELERQRELWIEKGRQRELERERQLERDRERQRERQEEMERQSERERLKEIERQIQREYDRRAAERELEQQREAERHRQKDLEKERLLEEEKMKLREYEKLQEREIESQKQRELERQKTTDRQKLDEMERWLQSDRQKAQEREKQRRIEDLKKIEELERSQLLEFQRLKKHEREHQAAKKKQEEGQREAGQEKRTAESPLRPKVLDLDNVSLGDRFGTGLSSDQSPTPRWKQPTSHDEEAYKPPILDVDSFRNHTQSGVSVDSFGMTAFSSLDMVRAKSVSPINPQSLLQHLERDPPPQSRLQAPYQSALSEQAGLPPPLQPQVLNQPGFQAFTTERPKPQMQPQTITPDWTRRDHQFDMFDTSQGEVAVDEPSWRSSTEISKRPMGARPSALDQILQRQRITAPILSPTSAPSTTPTLTPVQSSGFRSPMVPVQMPTFSLPSSPGCILSPDSLFAGGKKENQTALSPSVTEPIWSPSWEPVSREPNQVPKRSTGAQEQSRMRSRSVSQRPAPAETSVDGPLARLRSRSAHRDQTQDSLEQLKQSRQDEGKDTDTLVQETDSQYGTWDTDDSLTPVTPSFDSNLVPQTPDQLTPEEQKEPLNFPQSSTTLLDSSAQRSKAQLSKSCRRRRAPPSRAARLSAILPDGVELGTDEWRFKDMTEDKPDSAKQQDDESDEEESTRDSRTSTSSQPQRVLMFPGMDPSALMAQLKKRGETDSQTDGLSPSQLSRSPKSPFLGRASRVLPPVGGKENGEESSPQWLKELKTKKRFSQIENDA